MGKKSKAKRTKSENWAKPFQDIAGDMQTFAAPDATAGEAVVDEVTKLSRADLTREVGLSGTTWARAQHGFLPDDMYKSRLSGLDWMPVAEEMRQSGGPIAAVLNAICLPAMSTDFDVEGDSDELVDLVRENLLDTSSDLSMTSTWSDYVRRMMLMTLSGLRVFELVWKEAGGALLIKDLADRLPGTIAGFDIDDGNTLRGIFQRVADKNAASQDIALPISKLLVLPWAMEGDNWWGEPMFKPAYAHWRIVDVCYRLANVGLAHNLNNVPVGTLPPNYTKEDKAAFLALLQSAQQGDASAIALPPGYAVDSLFNGASSEYLLPYIQHHEGWISRAMAADWIVLGESSRTFGTSKMRFFLDLVTAVLSHGIAMTNRHVVRRMVLLNAPTAKRGDMPRIVHSAVGLRMDLQEAGDFLEKLATGKWISPSTDGTDENFFRGLLGMKEKDMSMLPAPPLPAPPDGSLSRLQPASQEPQPTVDATQAEQPAEAGTTSAPATDAPTQTFADTTTSDAVARVRAGQAEARDAWQQQAEAHSAEVLASLLEQVQAVGADTAQLGQVRVPLNLAAAWSGDIATWLGQARAAAMQVAAGGMTVASADPTAAEVVKAQIIAEHLAEAVRFEVVNAALRGETLDQIASRFAGVVNTRLRNDLDAAAQAMVDQINGALGG